jgi:hypothetical protein
MAAGKKSYRLTIRPRVKRCEPLRKAFMDLANEYGACADGRILSDR